MQKSWPAVLALWDESRPLIRQGYAVLDKTLVMGLPATSMPPTSSGQDTGIGSPYGKGAKRVWDFWQDIIQKIMIGPVGKTESATWHSPYLSEWNYNPFFIDLEQLARQKKLSPTTLEKIYRSLKTDGYIDFKKTEKNYTTALQEVYKNSKTSLSFPAFCDKLLQDQQAKAPFDYIGDIPIHIPKHVNETHPDWFLKDWTMGAPPDQYANTPQMWGFPILKPTALFKDFKSWKSGPAAATLKRLLRFYLNGTKRGIRIDHFIGWIDPYCFYTGNKKYPNGRLHSSPHIPPLKPYFFENEADFLKLSQEFLKPLFDEFHLSDMDIYPEDLGIRPPQTDFVLNHFQWGKMLPVQFNEPDNPYHLYHIFNATLRDIVVLSTHDNPSLLSFFQEVPEHKRLLFARQLAQDLRFQYTPDLNTPEWLYRMQWAAALASPARRVSAFFTSITGQEGRYNIPGTLDSWHLRCHTDFEKNYFRALKERRAYNPFEAIRWAIFARGDDFYRAHEAFVHKLTDAENRLFSALQDL